MTQPPNPAVTHDVTRNPERIWLSPICDDHAHHGDGRTWADPAPDEACDDCGEPWVEYVRSDLTRQSNPVAAGVGEGLREAVDALYQITNLTETEVWQEPRFVLEMAQEALAALFVPLKDLHARDALLLGGDAMRGEGQ